MASIFTKIVQGEIPCYKVAEDAEFLAFFDINPLKRGHTLVIPKKEVDYIFDLDADLYQRLWQFARKVGEAIEKTIPCERMGIAVIGLEVPHCHIHLCPIDRLHDLNFTNPRVKLSAAEFKELAARISANFQD